MFHSTDTVCGWKAAHGQVLFKIIHFVPLVGCPLAGLHLGCSHKQAPKADPNFSIGHTPCLAAFRIHPNPHRSAVRVEHQVLFVTLCLSEAGTGLYGSLYTQNIK